jgi:hypothetical protein
VWSSTGGFTVRPDAVALPDELLTNLAEWGRFYDETLSSNGYEWPSDDVERAFAERGRELPRRVATALGPDFEVLYFTR